MDAKGKAITIAVAVVIGAALIAVVPMVSVAAPSEKVLSSANNYTGTVFIGETLNITQLNTTARDSVSFYKTEDPNKGHTLQCPG